jgi:hypothetical protein
MAASITIRSGASGFVPVYNPIEFSVVADAGTLALTGMKYIFDVYIENVSSPTYKRFEVTPDSVISYGTIDISRYAECACNSVLIPYNFVTPISLGARSTGEQSIIKITVKYGYSYLNSGVYTVVPDVTIGNDFYAFQGSLTNEEMRGFDYTDYICNITNGVNGQFLTDVKTKTVSINDLGATGILTDTPTDIDYVVYNTYDSTGTLIQTATKQIAVAQNLTSSRAYQVLTGPEHINNLTGAWVTGAQPVITSSVSYYTVQLTNAANVVASEILTFNVEEPCRYGQKRIHFANRLGGFDAYNFTARSQQRREVERKGYKYDKYPVTSGGIVRRYQDQSQVTTFVKTQDTLTVRSQPLTTAENEWLKQLVESPEIYLEITDATGAQNYLAYEKVNATTWTEKETSIDKIFILELELKLSQSNFRQRR